jgi:tRNA threonylcarbamoyladenosine biosynthesis protein TsaB
MTTGLTLSLDGSTYAGSVAVLRGSSIIAERQLDDIAKPGRAGRDEQFMPMVVECLRDAEVEPSDLACVVCGEGPGSFTSLRIAASIAKGIAVGADLPLFAVSSLMLVVAASRLESGKWLAALPAMRDESFVSLFEIAVSGAIVEIEAPGIVVDTQLAKKAEHLGARLIGPVVSRRQSPHARGVARIPDSVFLDGPCDIATWEPVYGRLAEAQVRWEAAHGRPLTSAG